LLLFWALPKKKTRPAGAWNDLGGLTAQQRLFTEGGPKFFISCQRQQQNSLFAFQKKQR